MSTTSNAALGNTLRQHRLLDAKQLEELPSLQARFPDPTALARELIQRGWLTPYQANQLLQGKGQELVLGSYLLLERLGEGGMGQVFKARHRTLGRIAAIKLMHQKWLDKPDAIRRFQREVRTAAALSHPNIVLAYDADQIGDTHLLVMECVEGATDLAKLVKTNGPLPVAQACEYVRQAALGLQYAYERGVVHRDIKPANLLLTAGGMVVKILDMGLARLDQTWADDESSGTMTQQGAVMGTPDYIAPEQTRESHTVDIRADLYSLGCTFYFLLTGQVPFPGGTMMEKLLQHRREEPRPVEQLRPGVPPRVAAVVRKLMAKKPEHRYQTPAELVRALASDLSTGSESSLEGNVSTPTAVVEATSDTYDSALKYMARRDDTGGLAAPDRLRRKVPQRTWLAFGVAGGSFFLIVGVIWLFWLLQQPVANKPRQEHKGIPTVAKNPGTKHEEVAPPMGVEANPSAVLLEGKWYYLGPFDNPKGMKGFDTVYPPEQAIDLKATYQGNNNQPIHWQQYPGFKVGVPLAMLPFFEKPGQMEWACTYLYHEIEVAEATFLPTALGSAGTLTVWLNEERLLHLNVKGGIAPHDKFALLKLKPGKNKLLVKLCQGVANWGFYIAPVKESDLPFHMQPGFDSWCKEVAALPAEGQVQAVAAKLKACNSGFDGKLTKKIEGAMVTALKCVTDHITDISAVRALPGLQTLDCSGTHDAAYRPQGKLADLSPLKDMKLTGLNCNDTQVSDLSPLKNMKLTTLSCYATKVSNLSPLKDMELTSLNCGATKVTDLSPLMNMKLTVLGCNYTKVSDLSPLMAMKLTGLSCNHTQVSDLAPLKDMTLTSLDCSWTHVSDLSPLKDLKLTSLNCAYTQVSDLSPLKDMMLTSLNCGVTKVSDLSPLKDMKLTSLDCSWTHVSDLSPLKDMKLTSLNCGVTKVSDLSPLKNMKLTSMKCSSTPVSDLSPLKDMKLTTVHCGKTLVSDLSPLKDMKLTELCCDHAQVSDLSPLKDMPLRTLRCDFQPERDTEILHSIRTLRTINDKPAKDFWKEVDEKKLEKKP